jgi:hypothetical protein
MSTVTELWAKAHETYAKARASVDAATRNDLLRLADDYLKQAEDIRREQVTRAVYPEDGIRRFLDHSV